MKMLLIILIFSVTANAQIYVSGTDSEHDSIVVEAVKLAYPNVTISRGTETLNQTLVTNLISQGYKIIVRSTTGYNSYSTLADDNPTILFVMPSGSNEHANTEITLGNILSTGAGTDSNVTGYPIHFYGTDPIGDNQSSYSNGYIAGIIAKLSDAYSITPPRAVFWLKYLKSLGHDGYGRIETSLGYYEKYHRKLYIKNN